MGPILITWDADGKWYSPKHRPYIQSLLTTTVYVTYDAVLKREYREMVLYTFEILTVPEYFFQEKSSCFSAFIQPQIDNQFLDIDQFAID